MLPYWTRPNFNSLHASPKNPGRSFQTRKWYNVSELRAFILKMFFGQSRPPLSVYLINAHFLSSVYRAQFPYTYKEMMSESDMKTVLPGLILLTAISIWAASFLRSTSKFCVVYHKVVCAVLSSVEILPLSVSPQLDQSCHTLTITPSGRPQLGRSC